MKVSSDSKDRRNMHPCILCIAYIKFVDFIVVISSIKMI